MSILIVTTCTNKKGFKPPKALRARNLPRGTLEQTVEKWLKAVAQSMDRYLARDLYRGRGITEPTRAANFLNAPLYIISAGLGLVKPDQLIPAYDLTLSKTSEDFINKKVVEPLIGGEWWTELTEALGNPTPIRQLCNDHVDSLILMSCSGSYLDLVREDLFSVSEEQGQRLRLFGPRNLDQLPLHLRDAVMPYPESFDGHDSPVPGTRSHFGQRALRHFVDAVLLDKQCSEDLQSHRNRVLEISSKWAERKIIARTPKTDEEILQLIPKMWDRARGSSARMLRVLRDDERIACEQGRFAQLFKLAKEKGFVS